MKVLGKPRYKVIGEMTPFDERDNVHARYELEHDASEWEEQDRKTKSLPGIGKVGHPWDLSMLGAQREILAWLGREDSVDGPVAPVRQEIDPARAAEKIIQFGKSTRNCVALYE